MRVGVGGRKRGIRQKPIVNTINYIIVGALTPMQKPHLRAGWMLISLTTFGLSRPSSMMMEAAPKAKAALGATTASCWWGAAASKKAVEAPTMARRRMGR